jgi:hypothetical protein
VLRLTQPLERVGYITLLYFTVEKFYYNWSMLLKPFTHCSVNPNLGVFTRNGPPIQLSSTGTKLPLFCIDLVQNRTNWANTSSTLAVPFGRFSVIMECTFTSNSVIGFNYEIGCDLAFGYFLGPSSTGQQATHSPGTVTITHAVDFVCPLVTGGGLDWWYRTSPIPVGIGISEQQVHVIQHTFIIQ